MTAPLEKKAKKLDWFTPERVLGPVRRYFSLRPTGSGGIDLDPATSPGNPVNAWRYAVHPDEDVEESVTCHKDGLKLTWWWDDAVFTNVFVNPPYGRGTADWCKKIGESAQLQTTRIVALLPANRDETTYLQEHILDAPTLVAEVRIRRRLDFRAENGKPINKNNNPYGSRLYVFDRGHNAWGHVCMAFGHLGFCLRVTDRCRGVL